MRPDTVKLIYGQPAQNGKTLACLIDAGAPIDKNGHSADPGDSVLARIRAIATGTTQKLHPPPPVLLGTSGQDLWASGYKEGLCKLPEDACYVGSLKLGQGGSDDDDATLHWSDAASTIIIFVQAKSMPALESAHFDRDCCDTRFEEEHLFSNGQTLRQRGLDELPSFLLGSTPYHLECAGAATCLSLRPPTEAEATRISRALPARSLFDFVCDGRPVSIKAVFQTGVSNHSQHKAKNQVQEILSTSELIMQTLAHVVTQTAVDQLNGTGIFHPMKKPTTKPIVSFRATPQATPRVKVTTLSDIFVGSFPICSHTAPLVAGRLDAATSVIESLYGETDARLLKILVTRRFRGDKPDLVEILEFCATFLTRSQGLLIVIMSARLLTAVSALRLTTSAGGTVQIQMDTAQRLAAMANVPIVVIDDAFTQAVRIETPFERPKHKLCLSEHKRAELVAQFANHSLITVPPAVILRDADVEKIVSQLREHIDQKIEEKLDAPDAPQQEEEDSGRLERREKRKRRIEEIVQSLV